MGAGLARSHPYTSAVSDGSFRYMDLRASPELIRTTLEDFVAFGRHPAIQTFYRLVEHLNGADSALETNDCAFEPPARDPDDDRVICAGRVMVLFRDLPRNLLGAEWEVYTQALHEALCELDPDFEQGMIGTTPVRVHFRELPASDGAQLMISFWAWGDTERACWANLARVMSNLEGVLRAPAR